MSPGILNFAERYGIAINDPDLIRRYRLEMDWLRDERTRIAVAENRGIEKGIEKGIGKGILKTLKNLVDDGIIDLKVAAERANMSEALFLEKTANL